jgi:hypothetical protein
LADLRRAFRKTRDFFGFNVPLLEMPPERREEIIEKIASNVVKFGLEIPVELVGWMIQPMSTIVGQTTLLPMAPFLELLGLRGYEYVAFFRRENVKRLLERIEQLEKERDKS